ncbi:ABC-type transport auxiliary lipoprotein family protein [Ideonella sp. DXS29W]|uniref:ABC-type transport auxiliary lipoprotein family protein n=1 Tax=Ideonella lacteola TaxID=2984193 RepID=A0ABU9BY93_9BURK
MTTVDDDSRWGIGGRAGMPLRRAALTLAMVLVAGCATSEAPPLRYHALRLDRPQATPATPAPPRAAPGPGAFAGAWQLVAPVRLPDYLDRDVMWVPGEGGALVPLDGHRWAEPLRTAVPRLLAHDLGDWRGDGAVWGGAVPAGVEVGRQLRLELLEFGATPDGKEVALRAKWAMVDPHGADAPVLGEVRVMAPVASRSAGGLVDAHRLALWRLAERVAQSAAGSR